MYFCKDSGKATLPAFCMCLILTCQHLTSPTVLQNIFTFGLCFSPQSHRSPFKSLADKAGCLYKPGKHKPRGSNKDALCKAVCSFWLGWLAAPSMPFLRPLARTIPSTASLYILHQECNSCSSRHCCDTLACELALAF